MYKVKRFSIIKESLYALRRNIKSRWSNESDKLVRSSDIRNHPNEKNGYSSYIPVWTDPDGNIISKFNFLGTSTEFESDLKLLETENKILKDRVDLIIKFMKDTRFPCVFNDNDYRIHKQYWNESNSIEKNWDTRTHLLGDFCDSDMLVYSKWINNVHRLTYSVYKPKMDGFGNWKCDVRLSRCYEHHYDKYTYNQSNNKNTISGNLSAEDILKILSKNRNLLGFYKIL